MKKVGIITFHRSRNYGAVLQAYALQTKLKKSGIETEVIDYQNKTIEEQLRLWNRPKKFKIKPLLYSVKQFVFRYGKKRAFDKFISDYIILSQNLGNNVRNFRLIENKYTACITGSDQVWNRKLTEDDTSYFLDFVGDNTIKIAYAASVGDDVRIFDEKMINRIEDFLFVSVRENSFKNYLYSEFNKQVELCCDPTLLLEFQDYIELIEKSIYKKKYLFVYTIQDSKEVQNFANQVARTNNLAVISNKNCIPFWMNCSPKDFLNWMYHAEYIITNSFHGTIFSIIFHKKFLSYIKMENGSINQRIYDLLNDVNLMKRGKMDIQTDVNRYINELDKMIDYKSVDTLVCKMRQSSEQYILQNL